jgi:hypothetical protein
MTEETGEYLNVEQLKVMCGGFFNDDVLENFYDAVTGEAWFKSCGECGLNETLTNSHLFYDSKTTDCIACSLQRSRRNNEIKRLQRQRQPKKRGRPKTT